MRRFLPIAVLVLGFAGPSRADLLFSNLLQSDNGSAGFDDLNVRLASDFRTDAGPWAVTSITAALFNPDLITHNVTFSIYTDNGSGSPDALLAAFDTSATILANTTGNSTATSAGINLQPNTSYWVVGQVNEPSLSTVTWRFNGGQGTDGGPFTTVPGTPFKRNAGLLWTDSDIGNNLFSLEGTPLPEPSTWAACGFVALLAGHTLRRKLRR